MPARTRLYSQLMSEMMLLIFVLDFERAYVSCKEMSRSPRPLIWTFWIVSFGVSYGESVQPPHC
jgi:hypothetical protein